MKKKLKLAILVLSFPLLLPALAFAGPLVDPTANPAGFLDQMLGFFHTSWPVGLALLVYLLLELAAFVGQDVKALAWLGKGRITLVLAGAIGVLGAGLNVYLGGGSLQSAFIAAVVAIAAYWHPQAPAVVAQQTRAPQTGSAALPLLWLVCIATFAWMVIATSPGCGAAQKANEHTLATCTEDAATKALEPAVQSILTSGVANWEAQLVALAVAFGQPEINCVVAFVEAELKSLQAGPSPATQAAIQRADAYLAAHPVTP